MSYFLWPHGRQLTRLPCSSLSPGACSNSSPLSQWCHTTISFSVAPFSSWTQSFPASGYFPMNHLFASGGESIGASASACLIIIELISFRIDCFDILVIQGSLKSLFQNHKLKVQILQGLTFCMVQLSHPQLWKTTALTICTFVSIATSLLF